MKKLIFVLSAIFIFIYTVNAQNAGVAQDKAPTYTTNNGYATQDPVIVRNYVYPAAPVVKVTNPENYITIVREKPDPVPTPEKFSDTVYMFFFITAVLFLIAGLLMGLLISRNNSGGDRITNHHYHGGQGGNGGTGGNGGNGSPATATSTATADADKK